MVSASHVPQFVLCGTMEIKDEQTWICIQRDGHDGDCNLVMMRYGLTMPSKFGITFNLPDLELRWHPGMTEDVAPLSRWHRSLLLSMLAEFKLWMFPGGDK